MPGALASESHPQPPELLQTPLKCANQQAGRLKSPHQSSSKTRSSPRGQPGSSPCWGGGGAGTSPSTNTLPTSREFGSVLPPEDETVFQPHFPVSLILFAISFALVCGVEVGLALRVHVCVCVAGEGRAVGVSLSVQQCSHLHEIPWSRISKSPGCEAASCGCGY